MHVIKDMLSHVPNFLLVASYGFQTDPAHASPFCTSQQGLACGAFLLPPPANVVEAVEFLHVSFTSTYTEWRGAPPAKTWLSCWRYMCTYLVEWVQLDHAFMACSALDSIAEGGRCRFSLANGKNPNLIRNSHC